MSDYLIGQARHEGGKLVEVALQCIDAPEAPHYHLYECEIADVGQVIELLKAGDQVTTIWRLPDGLSGSIPIEIVMLPDGEESIEVMQRGQPEGYRRMADMPRLDTQLDP